MNKANHSKTRLKKSTYFFIFFFVIALVIFCHRLFTARTTPTPDHMTITLTPFTAREQKDVIKAQEQEDQLDVAGPLIAQMSATEAQARVLNLNRSVKAPV